MKSISNVIIIILFLVVFVLLFLQFSDGSNGSVVEDSYLAKVDSLKELIDDSEDESRFYKDKNDSMNSVLLNLLQEMEEGNIEINDTPEEKEIKNLIMNVNRGWELFATNQDPDAILKYFLDEYTTNEVRINTEGIPFVKKRKYTNYREHLENIAEIDGLSIDMGEIKIYNVFIRNNIFASQYLTELTVRHEGKVIMESTVLTMASGESDEGEWKIGNYSWIRFEYFDIISEELRR